MAEYIEREKVLSMSYCTNKPTWDNPCLEPKSVVDVDDIEALPTADVVPSAVLEQVMWERDMALKTLKDHGIGFCEKSDMIEVRHGEWKYYFKENTLMCSECLYEHYVGTYHQYATNYCPNCGAQMDGKDDIE